MNSIDAPLAMEQHFVTFFSPGTIVAEETKKPIDSWDVEQAKALARGITERHGATPYAFQFTTRGRAAGDLDSRVVRESPLYYLGGTVRTLAEVEAQEPGSILANNMRCNRWERVITNDNSWRYTRPLNESDVVLDWP